MGPTTRRWAAWSAHDGRHPGARATGHRRDADGRDRPPPAGPQRPAGARRHRRGRLPPPTRLGVGGLPGGRPLLRLVGLPHHQPLARGVGGHGPGQPGGVLGPAGQAPSAGALSRRRGARARSRPQRAPRRSRRQRPARPPGPAGRRHLDPAVREQLALHLRGPVVLRAVLHALSLAAHLVPGD